MADVWDFGPDDPIDNSVLLRLANHCNDQGRQCFPSIAEVAKKVRRSERTVSRSIAQLEADGWLTVERGVGQGKTSHYVINVAMLKTRQAVTFPEDERGLPRQQKATATTTKGDSGDKPLQPLNGVTIREPSGEPSQTQPVSPASANLRSVNLDAGAELMAAVWFFEELAIPSDPGTRIVAAEAIRMLAKSAGGIERAAQKILEAAQAARGRGETVNRFWFTDQRYLQADNAQNATGGNNGANRSSITHERVSANKRAIAEALARRRVGGAGSVAGTDGRQVSCTGPQGLNGGVPVGFRAASAEVLPPESSNSSGGAKNSAGPEVLSAT
jgi:hypothetical protein